jgi:hypothetical protein
MTPPTLSDLYVWLSVPPTDDQTYGDALAAALEQQQARCECDPYTVGLRLGALRRAARILAARGAPLGVQDLGDFGSAAIMRWDALIQEAEADRLRGPFA